MISNKFISIDRCHQINLNIIDDTAYFTIETLNHEKCKTFLLLLQTSIDFMIKNNVKFIKQHIMEEDVSEFKKSEIISENGVFVVKTKIEDFLFELCDALGIKGL
jgi:hypothetical protein